jgi:hypothetical protein
MKAPSPNSVLCERMGDFVKRPIERGWRCLAQHAGACLLLKVPRRLFTGGPLISLVALP